MKFVSLIISSLGLFVQAQRTDMLLPDGTEWRDSGGVKFNCKWYAKDAGQRCGNKLAFKNLTSSKACVVCGGGAGKCVVDTAWTHPKHKDNCEAYISGKSQKFNCDLKARIACCTCPEGPPVVVAAPTPAARAGKCADKKLADGSLWHDSGGVTYTCEYYGKKASRCSLDGAKFPFETMTANSACCVCGGGNVEKCTDLALNGGMWHDSAGQKFNCAYYSSKNRCKTDGAKFKDTLGRSAQEACCACGGGTSSDTAVKAATAPLPDQGDNIISTPEYFDNTKFSYKKHLTGGFILYWDVDKVAKTITVGLLSPANTGGWISLGFSPAGSMAGADAIVGWFEGGKAVINDKHLENQSPSGIKAEARQALSKTGLFKFDGGRMGLVATRPWVSPKGGVEINAASAFVNVIFATGLVSAKCGASLMCNHAAEQRGTANLAFTAPPGMTVYDLNKGNVNEPCQGKAKLECLPELYCMHPNAINGDVWAEDFTTYGICANPQDQTTTTKDDESYGVQTIYGGVNGGFQNIKNIRGGFVLLWTLNKVSPPGSFGPLDTITMSVISTQKDKQGWIGFGWSPNGEMKGSDVVIGWSASSHNSHIGDYFLKGQISNLNYEAGKQELVNSRVIKKNGQLAISFERKLTPANSVQILEGLVHTIIAAGTMPEHDNPNFIPYHRFRLMEDVEFVPLAKDLSDANKMGPMELCAGIAKLECKASLICNLFSDDMLARFTAYSTSARNNSAATNTTGFTSASTIGPGSRRDSNSSWGKLFSNASALVGMGMCVTAADAARWDSMGASYTQAGVKNIKELPWTFNFKLRYGFEMFWDLLDAQKKVIPATGNLTKAVNIKIAVIASIGPGWLGVAMGTRGEMIGSSAIIGWSDSSNKTNMRIKEYYLEQKLPWEIKPIVSPKVGMEVVSMELTTQGHESALVFERPLIPTSQLAPIKPGPTVLLYAVGNIPLPNDDFFGYHRFRESTAVEFFPVPS